MKFQLLEAEHGMGFNRYIVECKSGISVERYIRKRVLIDT